MAKNYQTDFQKRFQVRQSYNLQYIKDMIAKCFLDEEGNVCSEVSISSKGEEEIARPEAEDLLRPFENPSGDSRHNPAIDVIENIHSKDLRGIKFALTSFRHENNNYICLEKRLI